MSNGKSKNLYVLSVVPREDFKLIIHFSNNQKRILDMKQFLKNDIGKLADIRDNLTVFMSAKIDPVSRSITFSNKMDFDTEVLFEQSIDSLD